MPMDVTTPGLAGYDRTSADCPHMATSPNADAWHVGQHLRRNGAPRPTKFATSRGQSIRVNGTHVFRLIYGKASMVPAVEAI